MYQTIHIEIKHAICTVFIKTFNYRRVANIFVILFIIEENFDLESEIYYNKSPSINTIIS